MKIELKKVSVYERMSEETTAFNADIFVDGVKAGYAKNDGHGGSTFYQPYEGKRQLLEKAEAFAKSLPDIKYPASDGMKAFSIESNLENVIDDLLEQEMKKKDVKKLEKKMEKSLLFGKPNSGSYSQVSFKIPLAAMPKLQLQVFVNKYKKEFKTGEKFLNTNLEALGIII
jgi:hypothetical protein